VTSVGTERSLRRIDFEDTYDGLGDTLDETDDVFNDDTFGGTDNTGKVIVYQRLWRCLC